MLRDMKLLDRTVVWIQGLMSFCANCYTNGLTMSQITRKTPWERIRHTNVSGIQKRFVLNGEGEKEVIRMLKHVFVRTEWDEACCKAINPNIIAHRCSETLRQNFYDDECWSIDNMTRHTIFMSQYSTPIKGFHQMLKALPVILQKYPDTVLHVSGGNLMNRNISLMNKIREPSYKRILREMITDDHLEEHIEFLGYLDGAAMKREYMHAHVFVTPSSIENSCNSIAEAMLTGTPVVASYSGGIPSMVTDYTDALLYPFNEYALLAKKICDVFEDDALAVRLSKAARNRALSEFDVKKNSQCLVEEYKKIASGQ